MSYEDLDKQLKQYESLRIAASKNRRDLYTSYDRSTLISNIGEVSSYEDDEDGLISSSLGSLWGSTKDNFSNLWNSINEEMDKQSIDSKLEAVSESRQDKEDLLKIQDYMKLVMDRDNLLNTINNSPDIQNWTVEYTKLLGEQLNDLNRRIQEYDDYFKGEGRTHKMIIDKMFDGTRASDINMTWLAIKNGWNQSGVTIDLYNKGIVPGVLGSAAEGLVNIAAKPLGVLGEIMSGAYGEAKAAYDNLTKDSYGNALSIRNYLTNIAQDGDKTIDDLYIGDKIIERPNVGRDLIQANKDVDRDYNDAIENVVEAQNDLKYGKVFGIPGLYDKDAITQDWRLGREDFQNGSIFGAFLHPFFATADIASSLDMMKYQLYAQGVDAAIKRLPEAFVKKIPGLGTALTAVDMAAGVGAALASRHDETALEAIDALGTRAMNETKRLGGNPEEIIQKIKDYGEALGINTDELDEGLIWKLGIAFDVHAGPEFELAKAKARQGINKLINANNALGISDWAQSIPYMSYFGDVTKAIKMPFNEIRDNFYIGNKTIGQRLGTKLYPTDSNIMSFEVGGKTLGQRLGAHYTANPNMSRYAEEMEKRIDGVFDRTVNKAAERIIKNNNAKAGLYQKHALQYLKKKGEKLLSTAASEAVEEAQQYLLQERYGRGEYDDYKMQTSMFDINEFVLNNALAATAVADYFGAGWWDANNGDADLVKAANIGMWSSFSQGNIQHAFTNFTEPNGDNIRGLARQLRSDNVAVRILADQQKNLQDQVHIDMYYDRFMHGGNWQNMLESLSTLSKALDPNETIKFKDPNTGQEREMLPSYAKRVLNDELFEQATGYTKEEYDRVTATVKKSYIDDDIKLMTATWMLFSDENIDKAFKEEGISKNSEEYRQFLRDGATAITDFYKTSELMNSQSTTLDAMQDYHKLVISKLLSDETPAEEKLELISKYPKLANFVDQMRVRYKQYLDKRNSQNKYILDPSLIKSAQELYDIFGEDAIEAFGIDDDLLLDKSKNTKPKVKDILSRKKGKQKKTARDVLESKSNGRLKDVSAARLMAQRIFDSGRVSEFVDHTLSSSVEEFKKRLLSGKTKAERKAQFRNNKFVNDYVNANKPHTRAWLGDLDEIFDNEDTTEFDEIIKGAYLEYRLPRSEEDYILNQAARLHNYKKLQAVIDNLEWTQNQELALKQVRYMTGLDVDPTNISGWVNEYKRKIEMLKKQESQYAGEFGTYKDMFSDDIGFDDDDSYLRIFADFQLNAAIKKQQQVVAAAYRRMQANPESLKNAVFGETLDNTILDDIINERKTFIDDHNSQNLLELDERQDKLYNRELSEYDKRAAWKLIKERIKNRIERNKVAHRQFEEDQERPIVHPVDETSSESDSSSKLNDTNPEEKPSDAEIALKRDFYHDNGKKKTEKEKLEEAREIKRKRYSITEELADEPTDAEDPEIGGEENETKPEEKPKKKKSKYSISEDEDLDAPGGGGDDDKGKPKTPITERTSDKGTSAEGGDNVVPPAAPDFPSSPEPEIGEISDPVVNDPKVDTSEIEKAVDGFDPDDNSSDQDGFSPEDNEDKPDFIIDVDDPSVKDPVYPFYDSDDTIDPEDDIYEDVETDEIVIDGVPVDENEEEHIRREKELESIADKRPVTIDEVLGMDGKSPEDVVGDTPIDLIWLTCFYAFKEQKKLIKLSVNGKLITSFNGKQLRPGAELAKKLLIPGWLLSCKTYYVVTLPLKAKNKDANDKDAFTVALIIEDEKSSYAATYRALGEILSESSKVGRDGKKIVYHNNGREDLKNWLLLKNADTQKILKYIKSDLQKPSRKSDESDEDFQHRVNEYRKALIKAYQKAINDYARELFSDQYARQHANNTKAKLRAEKEWDSIGIRRGESEEDFNARKKLWEEDHRHYTDLAKAYFALPNHRIYTDLLIEDEINKLKRNRDEIIDAYLDKDDKGNYIFPDSPKIGYTVPVSVKQSNGRINTQKKPSGEPVLRNIDDRPIDSIQEELDKENILLGIGKGVRARHSGPKSIVSFRHILGEEERVFFGKGGLSGKLYWIVSALSGNGHVPIMLGEEKFDVQHREADGGGLETVSTRGGANKILLLIEKVGGKLDVKKSKYKPSAAEVLLYMILGENVLPGFSNIRSLVPLFINEDPSTLLEKQPTTKEGLLNNLAAKQLYYGPTTALETTTTEGGGKITRRVVKDANLMFNIGLKQTELLKSILNSIGIGTELMNTDGHYSLFQFTKELIMNNEALRAYIVQAMSEQMHWNTDAATFIKSASVSIRSSILGQLINHLINLDAEAGRFDGMTAEEYLNSEVSIMGCPQLSFKIGDFFTMPDTGAAKNLASLEPRNGTIMAWMIKSGHIKTDAGEELFIAPFVYANGVKTPKKKSPSSKASLVTSAPILEETKPAEASVKDNMPKEAVSDDNAFADEDKTKKIVQKLPIAMRKGVIDIPKTRSKIREKLEEWTKFLLSDKAKDTKFAGLVDVKENDILDMIILRERDEDDVIEYANNLDLHVSEDDVEGLDKMDKSYRDVKITSFVAYYKYRYGISLGDPVQNTALSLSARNRNKDTVETIIVYREKSTGEVKFRVDSISVKALSNIANAETAALPVSEKRYNIKAATGVFSRRKGRKPFNEEKARAWLAEKLGIDQSNVIVMDAMKAAADNSEVFGVVDTAVDSLTNEIFSYIGLSRRGGNDVHYHEAWHYVNLLLHDDATKRLIYKAYLKSHPLFRLRHPQYKEVEERLAEDFRKWMNRQEDTTIKGSILRMFENVLDTMFIFKYKSIYKDIFKLIREGAYKGKPMSKATLKEFHDAYHKEGGAKSIGYYVPTLSKDEDKGLKHIYTADLLFGASTALAKHFVYSKKLVTERDLELISGAKVDDILKELSEWVDSSDEITEDKKDILREILKNPERVKRSILDEFEELGVTVKVKTIKGLHKAKKNNGQISSTTDEETGIKESDQDEVLNKEEKPDNTWDVFDFSISKKDNASIRTKLFMKQIPRLERVPGADGKPKYLLKYDDYGNEEMWSFSNAWNFITDKLWLCESIDDVNKDGTYKLTSMMGMIERFAKSDVFFMGLLEKMQTIDSSKFLNTILKSQLYATINSNKPQVSFLNISDPIQEGKFSYDDFGLEIDGVDDEDNSVVDNTSVADRQRNWTIHNDNTVEANKNLLRSWSTTITGQGLISLTNDGKATVSTDYANSLKTKMKTVRDILKNNDGNDVSDKKRQLVINEQLIPAIIDLYDEIGISVDEDVLMEFVNAMKGKMNPTVKEQWDVFVDQFLKKETFTEDGKRRERTRPLDSVPRIIDAIISEGLEKDEKKNDYIKFVGDKRQHALDKLFSGFTDKTSSVYKLAAAVNAVHPSARQFSVKDPSGNTIYPISSNSFVSDRVRKLSINGKEFGKRMKKSAYCGHSQFLDIAINNTDPIDTNSHFKLNVFVGIKDGNRSIGNDYFGITPMEDYLAKMMMLEQDLIILPTMADKKTWYSISHKDLLLSHDCILTEPFSDTLNQVVYDMYREDHPEPETDTEKTNWRVDARGWYRNLETDSDVKKQIDDEALRRYKDDEVGVGLKKYSDNTLSTMANYMVDELEAVIAYYDPKRVARIVKNKNLRVANYHGQVLNGRLDFSGNGGKFRYFYDVITFTDDNGNTYNLNQRLQMLYELLKKIESGNMVNLSSSDPLYKYIGGDVLEGKTKDLLDGFELVRLELHRIQQEYFKNGFPSKTIKNSINDIFILRTMQELESLSDPQNPAHMVSKKDGRYVPFGIPAQLLNKYANEILKVFNRPVIEDSYANLSEDPVILQGALFSLIANTVVNSAISIIEFEKVFSGDPAFYSRKTLTKVLRVESKDKLPKKGKSGVMYITSDTESAYSWNNDKYELLDDANLNGVTKINQTIEFEDGSSTKVSVITDNVYDSFSDKIKRLGSTLSPGDELRLYYSKEELEKGGRKMLSIDSYTNMNVEDVEMKSVFMDTIEKSFRKQLLIDNIRMLDFDKFNKYCSEHGISFGDGIDKIYKDDKFFKEIYDMFPLRKDAIENALAVQIKPYTEINLSDALVFIRPELYRRIRIGLGQWSNDDEYAYMILEGHDKKYTDGSWMSDPKIYKAVRKLQLYPLKMSYFQNDPMDDNGRRGNTEGEDGESDTTFEYNKPILNKMAIFPWFRFMAGNGVGAQIYERMNRRGNELDMISFKSAVKAGAAQKGADMKTDDNGENLLSSIGEDFFKNSSLYIDYDSSDTNADFGKVKSNFGEDTVAVEIQYLQNLRFQLNTEAHDAESRNIGTQMFKLAFSSVIDDEYYGRDENGEGGMLGKDIKNLIMATVRQLTDIGLKNLLDEFYTNGLVNQDKVMDYIISIVKNNNMGYTAEQLVSNGVAESLSRRETFENSATAIVNSEVIDINTPGGSAVQQSCFGFQEYNNTTVQEQIGAFRINFNNGKMLKWSTKDNTMEIMLSMNFFRHVLPKEMKNRPFEELRQWLINHDIIGGTKKSIPAFKYNDKEYSDINPEWDVEGSPVESNPKPFGVGYRIPTQGLSSIFGFTVADVLPPQCGDLIIVPPEFTAQTGSDFDVDKLYLATKAYKNGQEEEFDEVEPTKGGLTNRLLGMYLKLLCDDKNYSESRASIDTFTKMLKTELIDAEGVLRDPRTGYLPSFTELMPMFQMNRKLEFSIGKSGIAPFALNVTNIALTQYAHLTMHYEGEAVEYNLGSLDAIEGQDGLRISGWLSAMVNAHVDVAKDPYIFDLNVNHATYNYANFLIRAGKGLSTFTFLAQQSLKNIAADINNSGGIYGGNIKGENPNDELTSVSKNRAIKAELKRLESKLESLKNDISNLKEPALTKEQLNELDNLIEYLKYERMGESKKKEYRKDNGNRAPKFGFERSKVFDKDYAIKILKSRRSSKELDRFRYLLFLVASVRAFKELSVYAQGISSLVSVSLVDTKKFGNTIRDQINFENKIEHFEQEGSIWTINEEGFEDQFKDEKGVIDRRAASKEAVRRYFDNSYLRYKFNAATGTIKDILKQQMITATDEYNTAFRAVLTRINGGIGLRYDAEYNLDKIDAIGTAIENVFRFNILFNVGKDLKDLGEDAIDFTLGGDKSAVMNKMRVLIYGDDDNKPLYQRLHDFKRALKAENAYEKYPGIVNEDNEYSNDLIDSLIPIAPTGKVSIGQINLKVSNRDTDSNKKNKLVASFAQLLSSSIPEVRQLAEDLAFYAYYSYYDQDVRNSFFDLVPPPYREQYDRALKDTLKGLLYDEQKEQYRDAMFDNISGVEINDDVTGRLDVNKLIDVICRNYWYDDDIVARYYPGKSSENLNEENFVKYGPEKTDSFPLYIASENIGYKLKKSPYLKIRKSGNTMLYREIGIIKREYTDEKRQGEFTDRIIRIFAPVPKVGYNKGGIHMYELFSTFEDYSNFKDNRLSPSFAMSDVRRAILTYVDSYNERNIGGSKSERIWTASIEWQTDEIPDLYDITNTNTYKEIVGESEDLPVKGIKILMYGKKESAWHGAQRKADVIINLTNEKDPDLKHVPEEYRDKVINIDINNPLDKNKLKQIKDSLTSDIKYVTVVKPSGKVDVQITKQDIEEFLQSYGELSEKTKARIRKNIEWVEDDIKMFVAGRNFAAIWDNLSLDGVYLNSIYSFGDVFTTKMILFSGNTLIKTDKVAGTKMHVNVTNWKGNKSQAKRMYYTLTNYQTPDFVEQNVSSFVDELLKHIKLSDTSNRAKTLMKRVNDKTQDENDKSSDVEPVILDDIDDSNREDDQNKECGGTSQSSTSSGKKSKYSVSEDIDEVTEQEPKKKSKYSVSEDIDEADEAPEEKPLNNRKNKYEISEDIDEAPSESNSSQKKNKYNVSEDID